MYAPCARSSFANVCSTRFSLDVTFFALSFGTVCPQFVHCTVPEDPFPPLVRPLLARLSGMNMSKFAYLYSCRIFPKFGYFVPVLSMKIPHVLILDRMNSIDNHAWSLPYLF
jgi:hypothetical protein